MDAAGNEGAVSTPYSFSVDAKLPVDGEGSSNWLSGWRLWAVVGGAAGLGLLLIALAAIWCARRDHVHAHVPQGFPAGFIASQVPLPDQATQLVRDSKL